jgi:hypothetical protein
MSSQVIDQYYNQSYMPLNVGDIRQMVWVEDSATVLWTITGTTLRKDGTPVYCMEWKTGTSFIETYYYLNKGGYFLATELDTTRFTSIDKKLNPYGEQRLAKLSPKDGEKFLHTVGDSDNTFWTTHKEGSVETFCGLFEDVYSFTLIFGSEQSLVLSTYYAKGYGYLGTSGFFSDSLDYMVTYIKIGGVTRGTLWPEKDFGRVSKVMSKKKIYYYLINGYRITNKKINNKD